MSWSSEKAREHDQLLPVVNISSTPPPPTSSPARRALKAICFASLVSVGLLCYVRLASLSCIRRWNSQAPPLGLPDTIQKRWGQYAPYFPAGRYVTPPEECEVKQVHILHRHGARYPNEEDDYPKAVKHLLSAKEFRDSNLYFLKNYEYNLPEEVLTPFGAEQSFESGEAAYRRYGHLVTPQILPYVRASGLDRVIKSAGNWTVGFAASSQHHINPFISQILSEEVNNTLNNDCPNASQGVEEKETWLHVFAPPIVKRLKKAAKGAKVTVDDIHRLMALCPFESIAYEKPSPFCDLFTPEEWQNLEYYGDVEKYYKTGYGNPLGPIQGVGYVNELLARLTGLPPRQENTTHNHSLPFPLDRTLYVDFTHENSMIAVFSAMGLFNVSANPPSPKKMEPNREWTASRMVPFSARMVVEKLACEDTLRGNHGEGEDTEYVRILVNDDLQPLEFCGAKGKGEWKGLCSLKKFVASQGYARRNGDGDFEKCY